MKILVFFKYRLVLVGLYAFLLGGLSMQVNAMDQSDTLVIYLSRTQNNKVLATFIAQTTGGDLAAIETKKPYPRNYSLMRDQVIRELADGSLPPIQAIPMANRYRRIIIVFPTWAMQLPPPVKTFLNTHNLQGKTVLPLNTNAGYGVGSGFKEIKSLAIGADVRTGLSLKGGNERDGNLFVMQSDTLQQAKINIKRWLQANRKY